MDEREKIIKIISEWYAHENRHCYIYSEQIQQQIKSIADTLIAANIGDVSWWERKCKLCEEDWFLQKKQIEHYAESYKEMLQEDLDKYKHRAEVAERALFNMTKKYILAERKIATTKDGQFSFGERLIALFAGDAIKQAEKELAEEEE